MHSSYFPMDPIRSKHAEIARTGNRVEQILCTQESVRTWLSGYFQKKVVNITKIKGCKKSDNLIEFEDGSTVKIQNKNGSGGGRGWSVDRREVSLLTDNADLHTLLRTVCLKQGSNKPEISNNLSILVSGLCLRGSDDAFVPDYFTHTRLEGDMIVHMSICPMDKFMEAILQEMYAVMLPKRTCVHLSPSLYFQRKGGGSADSNPDHIQTKLHCSDRVHGLFVTISPC